MLSKHNVTSAKSTTTEKELLHHLVTSSKSWNDRRQEHVCNIWDATHTFDVVFVSGDQAFYATISSGHEK